MTRALLINLLTHNMFSNHCLQASRCVYNVHVCNVRVCKCVCISACV